MRATDLPSRARVDLRGHRRGSGARPGAAPGARAPLRPRRARRPRARARLGLPFAGLRAGLEAFTGTGRRMERKGEAGGVRVYDSYAHHPVEIAGDLQAARALAGGGRLVVAFQPHLVSRTRIFGAAMGAALGAADEVVVLDVYVAREDPDPEVTGRLVADAVPLAAEHVRFVADLADAPAELLRLARPGDLVLTLGAGSVTDVGPLLLALLEDARDHAAAQPAQGDRPPDPASASRRRFARRQWLRRWLVWRYVIALGPAGRPRRGRRLAGLLQLVPHRPAGPGAGRVACSRGSRSSPPPTSPTAPTSPARPRRDPGAGRRPGARTTRRRLARLAPRRPDQGHRAHPRRRGRDRWQVPRHGRRGRALPRLPAPTGGMPRVVPPRAPAAPRWPRPPA